MNKFEEIGHLSLGIGIRIVQVQDWEARVWTSDQRQKSKVYRSVPRLQKRLLEVQLLFYFIQTRPQQKEFTAEKARGLDEPLYKMVCLYKIDVSSVSIVSDELAFASSILLTVMGSNTRKK
jgi:hypothetical protein